MKKLVLFLCLFLICSFLPLSVTANQAEYTGKIGVSLPTATHGYLGRINWWAKKAIEDWKEKSPNVEFVIVTAESVTKQAADIEDLMIQEIDSLVVFPFDASLTPIIEKVHNEGVFTVVISRGTTKPVYDVYISNDDATYARTGMEWVCKELDYNGKVVIIEGIPTPINTIRVDTINAIADQYPGIEILDSQPGEWNQQKALSVMENYLQKYPQIDAVYTADDDMLKGALQAYQESGRNDIKVFLGGAAMKDMLERIINGDPLVKANVSFPPDVMATAVSLGVLGHNEVTLEGFYQQKLPIRIILSSEIITAENVDRFYHPDEMN